MKLTGLLLLSLILTNVVWAQEQFNFGNAFENQSTRKTINTQVKARENVKGNAVYYITLVEQMPFYGYKLLTDSIVIKNADTTLRIGVEFNPKQNMQHTAMLLIETKSEFVKSIALSGQGKFSNSYYNSTQNKSGEALKAALKSTITSGYRSLSYNQARDNMYGSIDNKGGFVECVYTGQRAKFNTRSGANSAGFNCEHTFPQGHFSSASPMKSDMHHLFPTTASSNSRRGNDPFGVVSSASWSQGGSKSGGGKFEPRDVHKGAVARAMTYFVLRYQDYRSFYAGQEAVLRTWMQQNPPSQKDTDRNHAIYGHQKNRNPFVDYPQFLDRISSITGTAVDKKYSLTSTGTKMHKQASDSVNGGATKEFVLTSIYNNGTEAVDVDRVVTKSNLGSGSKIIQVKILAFKIDPHKTLELNCTHTDTAMGWVYYDDSVTVSFKNNGVAPIKLRYSGWYNTGGKGNGGGGDNSLQEYLNAGIKIYPNPANNVVSFKNSLQQEIVAISLLDLNGRVVKQFHASSNQFNISEIANGSYLFELKLNQGIVRKRVVIQH